MIRKSGLFTLVVAGIAVGTTVSYMQPAAKAPSVGPGVEILAQSQMTPPMAPAQKAEKVDVLAFFGDAEKTVDEADTPEERSRKLREDSDDLRDRNVDPYDSRVPGTGGGDAMESGPALPDAGDMDSREGDVR